MMLADYSSDERCFEFDLRTRAYSRLKLPAPRTNRAGDSGMAEVRRCPRKGKVLVAKYLLDGDAWFSIGAEKWKLFDGSLTLRHSETWGGLLCRLSLAQGGQCIRTLCYLRRDWLPAPLATTHHTIAP